MVFDASSKTPGGSSLNSILAKGSNRLANLQQLLLRFRRGKAAFSGDISMAYNNTRLLPEYFKYQRYLWKAELDPQNKTVEHVIKTLIYGVRSSGNQTGSSLSRLADHSRDVCKKNLTGADALKNDAYIDDVLRSEDSVDQSQKTATEITEVLTIGSMQMKGFCYSGSDPPENISGDGISVGTVGYAWQTRRDTLSVDVKKLSFGRVKRGKQPEPIVGNIAPALKENFTRRTLLSKVAGVFDPIGIMTPFT